MGVGRRRAQGVLISLALVETGCLSLALNGAEPHATVPELYNAHYRVSECRIISSGQQVEGPDADYYVADDERGPVLYEFGKDHTGVAFRNAWLDEDGQHFFGWVTNSGGWQFTFPRDAEKPPLRLIFINASDAVKVENGTYRPTDDPVGFCTLQRVAVSQKLSAGTGSQ